MNNNKGNMSNKQSKERIQYSKKSKLNNALKKNLLRRKKIIKQTTT